jgi:nucleotide-binding universal stress UspA family protein
MKMLVGVDGSESSARAVEWCATHAPGLHAEVVAAYAVETIVCPPDPFGYAAMPPPRPDPDELRRRIDQEWCTPLTRAGVPCRVVVEDGPASLALIAAAQREGADLVVVGRRGRGGFAELLLGSTSHALSHHLDRPLVIVP